VGIAAQKNITFLKACFMLDYPVFHIQGKHTSTHGGQSALGANVSHTVSL
jgi:hypothetical protein